MNDEIVTRLRIMGSSTDGDLCTQAADLIEHQHTVGMALADLVTASRNYCEQLEADRDRWRTAAELMHTPVHDGGCPAHPKQIERNSKLLQPISEQCDCGLDAYNHASANHITED
jgi:hypothetical protein